MEQLAIHFQVDGNLIYKDSEEAKRQETVKREGTVMEDAAVEVAETQAVAKQSVGDEDDDDVKVKSSDAGKEKKLTNQFNFSERASQTYNNPFRDRQTMTEPPPRLNFSSNATQWEIYDAYLEDFEAQVTYFLMQTELFTFIFNIHLSYLIF